MQSQITTYLMRLCARCVRYREDVLHGERMGVVHQQLAHAVIIAYALEQHDQIKQWKISEIERIQRLDMDEDMQPIWACVMASATANSRTVAMAHVIRMALLLAAMPATSGWVCMPATAIIYGGLFLQQRGLSFSELEQNVIAGFSEVGVYVNTQQLRRIQWVCAALKEQAQALNVLDWIRQLSSASSLLPPRAQFALRASDLHLPRVGEQDAVRTSMVQNQKKARIHALSVETSQLPVALAGNTEPFLDTARHAWSCHLTQELFARPKMSDAAQNDEQMVFNMHLLDALLHHNADSRPRFSAKANDLLRALKKMFSEWQSSVHHVCGGPSEDVYYTVVPCAKEPPFDHADELAWRASKDRKQKALFQYFNDQTMVVHPARRKVVQRLELPSEDGKIHVVSLQGQDGSGVKQGGLSKDVHAEFIDALVDRYPAHDAGSIGISMFGRSKYHVDSDKAVARFIWSALANFKKHQGVSALANENGLFIPKHMVGWHWIVGFSKSRFAYTKNFVSNEIIHALDTIRLLEEVDADKANRIRAMIAKSRDVIRRGRCGSGGDGSGLLKAFVADVKAYDDAFLSALGEQAKDEGVLGRLSMYCEREYEKHHGIERDSMGVVTQASEIRAKEVLERVCAMRKHFKESCSVSMPSLSEEKCQEHLDALGALPVGFFQPWVCLDTQLQSYRDLYKRLQFEQSVAGDLTRPLDGTVVAVSSELRKMLCERLEHDESFRDAFMRFVTGKVHGKDPISIVCVAHRVMHYPHATTCDNTLCFTGPVGAPADQYMEKLLESIENNRSVCPER